ncbi:MAG: bifunctional folylpolyglutamate synthase/dihydrofolate synthase, partial [Bryobacteraceae bacterium]
IERLLDALGNPHRGGRYIHVAGTNGKGSTCAMIEAGLRAAGVRTGLYTSPHLLEPTERIRIGGEPVSADQFLAAFDQVHAAAGRVLEEHPTYFETVTAMAFVLFRELAVETAVLEVGLGGRLDATNVVEPELAVITPVDFDHEAYLGRSLERIAAEKAGILKAGAAAVVTAQRPEAEAAIESRAAELGIAPVRPAAASGVVLHRRGSRFHLGGLRLDCPLAGEHQVENACTAATALRELGVKGAAIEAGIRGVRWPGRLDCVSGDPEIILDGAHNPAGARALASYIRRFYGDRNVTLIYGAMRDKSVEEISGILFPLAAEVIVTAPRQERAVRPETIAAMTTHPRLRIAPGVAEALERPPPAPPVFVTGSLFVVAEALAVLVK